MSEIVHKSKIEFVELSADIVSAFVSNNSIPANELGALLTGVFSAMMNLTGSSTDSPEIRAAASLTPAQIKKSILPDALISFEDGKPYKTLRRHLNIHNLTPQGYRAKWGLPSDYPMVSANYSAKRSELARSIGLGQKRNPEAKESKSIKAVPEASVPAMPKRAGRPRKTVAAK